LSSFALQERLHFNSTELKVELRKLSKNKSTNLRVREAKYNSGEAKFQMSDIAEALLDAFHSDARLFWDAKGASQVTARFEIGGSRVEVAFTETVKKDWEVGYTIAAARIKPAMESLSDSLRIVGGVLQAVTEFLEIRQPERLCIATCIGSAGK
jgi:hypothetical protein